ncbi:MAG: aminotransferase class IV [Planctomycetota bacterium]|jgi:branched-chain amino acid aminotransferase
MSQVWVHDGNDVRPAAEVRVPVLDHGFLFGDSVYDVVRTANGRPFMMKDHLDRLRRSGAIIYLEIPWSDEEIEARVLQVRERVDAPEAYIRIIATRGPGPISLIPNGCDAPGLYVVGRDLITYPREMYDVGCRCRVVSRIRNPREALDPKAKTGNYLNNALGLIEARKAGDDDALFLNASGHLTEATTANLWIVEGERIVTPPLAAGLLPGITRDWLFGLDEETVEEDIDRARLDRADEVFLTGTVKGVMPVSHIDGETVANSPGPVTQRLVAAYDAALAAN